MISRKVFATKVDGITVENILQRSTNWMNNKNIRVISIQEFPSKSTNFYTIVVWYEHNPRSDISFYNE